MFCPPTFGAAATPWPAHTDAVDSAGIFGHDPLVIARRLTILLLILAAGLSQSAFAEEEDTRSDSEKFTEDRYVVILGSYQDFHEAKRKAEGIAGSSKTRIYHRMHPLNL